MRCRFVYLTQERTEEEKRGSDGVFAVEPWLLLGELRVVFFFVCRFFPFSSDLHFFSSPEQKPGFVVSLLSMRSEHAKVQTAMN